MAKKCNELKKIVRFKNGVNPEVMKFVELQTNFSEAMTYLIEKELYENGNRDLVKYVPMVRTTEYFEAQPTHEPVKELEVEVISNQTNAQNKKGDVEHADRVDRLLDKYGDVENAERKKQLDIKESEKKEKKNDGDVLEQCFDD